jgi:peptidoglycan L-alanyl-D-glutamate endopeptidase CwlK
MRIEEMIAAVQQEFGIDVDGKAGPQTWGAIYERLVKKKKNSQKPSETTASADDLHVERFHAFVNARIGPGSRDTWEGNCQTFLLFVQLYYF